MFANGETPALWLASSDLIRLWPFSLMGSGTTTDRVRPQLQSVVHVASNRLTTCSLGLAGRLAAAAWLAGTAEAQED